jgi:hypothetical protein
MQLIFLSQTHVKLETTNTIRRNFHFIMYLEGCDNQATMAKFHQMDRRHDNIHQWETAILNCGQDIDRCLKKSEKL